MIVVIRQKIHFLKSRKASSLNLIEGQASSPFVMDEVCHGGIDEGNCEKRSVLDVSVVQNL
jgi:hypothetical protein